LQLPRTTISKPCPPINTFVRIIDEEHLINSEIADCQKSKKRS
jgi:hypothetical protein